jgi:hypothetical protein
MPFNAIVVTHASPCQPAYLALFSLLPPYLKRLQKLAAQTESSCPVNMMSLSVVGIPRKMSVVRWMIPTIILS